MHARWLLASSLVFSLAVGAGCKSAGDEAKPSPIPPGYALLLKQHQGGEAHPTARTTGGHKVDETLAVVDAEVLTRREMVRSLRIKPEDLGKPEVEDEIRRARLLWAREHLILGAARRAGMHIPPSMVDSIAKEQLHNEMKANEEANGVVLTEDEYLRAKHLTWREYREQLSGAITMEYYTRKLYEGIAGARPQIDKDVTPAEVRRIYYDNREKFDQPYGVKVALFQIRIHDFEREGRELADAMQEADHRAGQVAAAFRTGAEPKQIARQFALEEGRWQVSRGYISDHRHPVWRKWLFDRSRKPGDATVANSSAGPVVLGIVDVRQSRRRTLDDPAVYDAIVAKVQGARRERMLLELTLHLLRRGSSVWPPDLQEDLLDSSHELLDHQESDPVLGRVRMK